MTAVRIELQPESYELTLTTRHLHLHRQVGACEQLAQGCYLVVPKFHYTDFHQNFPVGKVADTNHLNMLRCL